MFPQFVLFCLLAFELPKVLFWVSQPLPVHIFPQFDLYPTESPVCWLIVHQAIAALLAVHLIRSFIFNHSPLPTTKTLHCLFLGTVFVNAARLGKLDHNIARGINITLFILLQVLSWYWNDFRVRMTYLVILSLPVLAGPLLFVQFLLEQAEEYDVTMFPMLYIAYIVGAAVATPFVINYWKQQHKFED